MRRCIHLLGARYYHVSVVSHSTCKGLPAPSLQHPCIQPVRIHPARTKCMLSATGVVCKRASRIHAPRQYAFAQPCPICTMCMLPAPGIVCWCAFSRHPCTQPVCIIQPAMCMLPRPGVVCSLQCQRSPHSAAWCTLCNTTLFSRHGDKSTSAEPYVPSMHCRHRRGVQHASCNAAHTAQCSATFTMLRRSARTTALTLHRVGPLTAQPYVPAKHSVLQNTL